MFSDIIRVYFLSNLTPTIRIKDMKKNYFMLLFIVMISILLIGCAGDKVKPTPVTFKPYKFQANQYEPKVDDFMVILDISSSMAEKYNGQPKTEIANNFLMAMNQTLPELKYNGALRIFGTNTSLPDKWTMSVYDLKSYSKAEFETALKDVKMHGGTTSLPLAKAIIATGDDLKSAQGPIAVIIVSDGKDMDQEPVEAAKALNDKFGDRLCIDTVQVGNDSGGKTILEQIAGASGCGFSTTTDRLANSSNLSAFVESVFLTKAAPMAAADSDGDGVPDNKDKCPNTPRGVSVDVFGCPLDADRDGVTDNLDQCPGTPNGATVDDRGCWTVALFYFDSTEVKPEAYPMLNDAVLIMKELSDLKVSVDGHTCSIGSASYNMTISVKRAEAVKNYFVSKGIDTNRLTTKGFGFTNPAASNDTKEGRVKNRRVELTPVK
jgi:OOP family OmpA-OmpF porin